MRSLGYPSAMDGVEQLDGAPARSAASPDEGVAASSDLPDLCPYLATIDGNWRSSSPVREHRCIAVTPPVPLALEKQRRLCLVAEHANCATYGAAIAARPSFVDAASARHRVMARTTPVVLDQARFDLRLPGIKSDRLSAQGLLVVLLALAFAAILIARPTGDGGVAVGDNRPTPTPAQATTAVASGPPRPSSVPSRAPVVTARPVSSPAATASTQPASPAATLASAGSTYRVKSGDTLTAIAARFGTTVKVLKTLNQISDPSKLHVGQVLQLP
jgi:hypothetical protein